MRIGWLIGLVLAIGCASSREASDASIVPQLGSEEGSGNARGTERDSGQPNDPHRNDPDAGDHPSDPQHSVPGSGGAGSPAIDDVDAGVNTVDAGSDSGVVQGDPTDDASVEDAASGSGGSGGNGSGGTGGSGGDGSGGTGSGTGGNGTGGVGSGGTGGDGSGGSGSASPCNEAPDAYEPNDVAPGAQLTPLTGDTAQRTIASTYSDDEDEDWFTISALERTDAGPVAVSWSMTGAMPLEVRVECRDVQLTSCVGGTLLPGYAGLGLCVAYGVATGGLTVECAESAAQPAGLQLTIGHQRWVENGDGAHVPGPNTTCEPEFTIGYAPGQ